MSHQSHRSRTIEQRSAEHYKRLRMTYELYVQHSDHKDFAPFFYKRILKEQTTLVPSSSVFLQTLLHNYANLLMIYGPESDEMLVAMIPEIRQTAETAFERGYLAMTTSEWKYQSQLPSLYLREMSNDKSLIDILNDEHQMLQLSDVQLLNLIAYSIALDRYVEDLSAISNELILSEQPDKAALSGFNRSQQVLLFYYLMVASGFHFQDDSTLISGALLLHQWVGIPVSDITGSDFYKKLKHPLEHDTPAKTIRNLQVIRSFLAEMSHTVLLGRIDNDIRKLMGKL